MTSTATSHIRGPISDANATRSRRLIGRGGARLRVTALVLLALLMSLALVGRAQAQAPVGLGTADSFAVLAGTTVTNTGPSVISGDLGVSPGNAVVGFPPGQVVNGTIHAGDAVAAQAQSDLTTAYNDAAGRACNVVLTGVDLGGLTLTSGVYCFATSAQLTGTLTLDAQGNPNAVFIFQIGSTLTTAAGSRVNLINAAQSCNVFWQVGSSATLGTTTGFRGDILALTSITANTGATVDGRLLARNGAVTLDTNNVTRSRCAVPGDRTGPVVDIDGTGGKGQRVTVVPVKNGKGKRRRSRIVPARRGAGGRARCIARNFRLEITARDKSGIRSVEVFVDRKSIKRTTRSHFFVWIRNRRLRAGNHTLRVVAIDRLGNRTVERAKFTRCARARLPSFTG